MSAKLYSLFCLTLKDLYFFTLHLYKVVLEKPNLFIFFFFIFQIEHTKPLQQNLYAAMSITIEENSKLQYTNPDKQNNTEHHVMPRSSPHNSKNQYPILDDTKPINNSPSASRNNYPTVLTNSAVEILKKEEQASNKSSSNSSKSDYIGEQTIKKLSADQITYRSARAPRFVGKYQMGFVIGQGTLTLSRSF